MEQIVDLLASFPKSGIILKTELWVLIYACLKFGSQKFQRVIEPHRITAADRITAV